MSMYAYSNASAPGRAVAHAMPRVPIAPVVPAIDPKVIDLKKSADALRLFDLRRQDAGPEGGIRAGALDENAAGLKRLLAEGWTEVRTSSRMIKGSPLDWTPAGIWSQFNHAIG